MKQKIVCEIHTHTLVSGHAFGTIREMALAAKEKELSLIGFSEHGPGIPGTCEPIYFGGYDSLPRNLYGVEILGGCEVNVLNDGTLSLDDGYMECLDYALAGIHPHCYKNEGIETNTRNVISCMKHPKVFFISHPDTDKMPLDYEQLVPAAKENHVALEVNNSSLRRPQVRLNCVENYRKMLSLCMEYRLPILISTDAHDPDEVGDFSLACQLIDQVGFDEDLILNNSVDKLKAFIGHQG